MTLTLAQLNPFVVTALVVLFVVICIAMILLILIQRPQGGGLSGAFGAGGGAGQTAFGTKTGDVLTLVTITIFVLFLVTAVILNFAARPASGPPPGTTVRELGEQIPAEGASETTQPDGSDEAPADASDAGQDNASDPAPIDPPSDDPAPDGGRP
jgi:preprotein translocase subunit SecG